MKHAQLKYDEVASDIASQEATEQAIAEAAAAALADGEITEDEVVYIPTIFVPVFKNEIEKVVTLPKNGYVFADGTKTGSLKAFTDDMLAGKGLLPVDEIIPSMDSLTQKTGGFSEIIEDTGRVTRTTLYVAKTQTEKDDDTSNKKNQRLSEVKKLLTDGDWQTIKALEGVIMAGGTLGSIKQSTKDFIAYKDVLRILYNDIEAGTVDPYTVEYPTPPVQ